MKNLTLGNFEFDTDKHAGDKVEVRHIPTGNRAIVDKHGGVIPESYSESNLPSDPDTGATFWNSDRNTPIHYDGSEYHVPVIGNDVKTSTTSVDNTTDKTKVHTANFVANSLIKGRVYHVKLRGTFSTDSSSDFFTYTATLGGTEIISVDSVAGNVSNGGISVDIMLTCYSEGSSGTVHAHADTTFNDNPAQDHAGETTVDTTAANTLDSEIQWDAAASGNTLTIAQARLVEVS